MTMAPHRNEPRGSPAQLRSIRHFETIQMSSEASTQWRTLNGVMTLLGVALNGFNTALQRV